ncbi:hypothetical protein ARHIZOSPH14_26660 [Agromyces rhizosphaerae]|uniref:Lipoprotein n=1 Tax=Agromyces rhizosphaerae TaxID=88374 RepID=A0A9W6FPV3_9MICO|nr:hypothetical protein [Agromyces rhizosphaerae]GLI28424.1 hypothetical protein ARHIZOSPH14_26660 [Agromyces rhizosphaerae]
MTRAGVALGASALLLACAGCTAGDGFSEPPPGLGVTVFQHRLDYAPRVLEVRLENGAGTTLDVTSVAFRSGRFDGAAVDPDGVTLTPGRAVALRIPLPASLCDASDPDPAVVDVTWAAADGSRTARLPAVDEQGVLDRINDEDCLAAAVDAVARLSMPERLRTEGSGAARRAWVDVSVEPAGGERMLRIDGVRPTTLLDGPAGTGWPLGLEVRADDAPSTIPLEIVPARCDPHAIAEDKRGTILPFEVAVGDRSGDLDLVPGDDLRGEIYAFVAERCELPTG